MRIKYAEGQTLLTLSRAVIVIVACLCVGGVYSLVNGVFSSASTARDSVVEILDVESSQTISGTPTVLYYSEGGSDGGQTSIYQMYYITGSEGAYGLLDAGGIRLLDDAYQDIILLPNAYVLKQNGQWRFYEKSSLALLSDNSWDEASVQLTDNGHFVANLVRVGRDGLYGATDMQGNVVIDPVYDFFEMSSLEALWPLIRVQQDGKYGFIDSSGRTIVSVTYDYAQLNTFFIYVDENDAEGVETPIIYVLRDGDWGVLYRYPDGSSGDVDWVVDPTEAVLEIYAQETQAGEGN